MVWISDGVDKYNFMDSRTGYRGTGTEGQRDRDRGSETEGQLGTEGQRDRDRGSEGQGQRVRGREGQRDRDRRTKYGLPMSVERPTECNMALA